MSDNNDEPIYSMLSGKILNAAPCFFEDPCPGGGPGLCTIETINTVAAWEGIQGYNMNDALVWCQDNSQGSGCLGVWKEFQTSYVDGEPVTEEWIKFAYCACPWHTPNCFD